MEEGTEVWVEGQVEPEQSDPSHVVSIEKIDVGMNLSHEEEPIQIMDCEEKVLRRKQILLVKVL
ncbi:ABC transporter G family member 33-like [Gossypium australe]|uniref:ABC transporter G family member 33-like n=1 Tax=Gossypium australe TaxID=47621 RepID=A0A5B6W702_9ROSI|nr:ABC transporter G family member 33-like [Gossypium australe]